MHLPIQLPKTKKNVSLSPHQQQNLAEFTHLVQNAISLGNLLLVKTEEVKVAEETPILLLMATESLLP